MIKLNINNVAYKMPEEYTIQQWMELVKWDYEEVLNYPIIINIACGAPIDQLRQADSEVIELAMHFIIQALEVRLPVKGFKNFEDLKFGEWVDLDVYFSLGIEKNLDKCMEILCPDVVMAHGALWVMEQYTIWRNSVYRSYSALFGLNDPKDESDEEVSNDKLHIARTWYDIIVGLANENILKIDKVVDEPYKKVFNFLARQKQKQLEENSRKLQERRQHDLLNNRKPL